MLTSRFSGLDFMTSENAIPLRGVYINLDSSEKRREHCERQIESFSLGSIYNRFPGIDGKSIYAGHEKTGLSPGKIGCWVSHMNAIRSGLDHDYHMHILEDDFQLTEGFPLLLKYLTDKKDEALDWDILFTDFTLAITKNVFAVKEYISKINSLYSKKLFSIEDALSLYAAGNSSYIVNRRSKDKIASILENGLGAKIPKDLYLREKVRKGEIKAAVTLPFLTTLDDLFMESDILGTIDNKNPSIIFNVLFRKSLSWGADTKSILRTIKKRLAAQPPINDRSMIYTHLVGHFVSDDYKVY